MIRSRFLVVWIVVVGFLVATSLCLSAAEKNAAKPAAEKPKAQFSAVVGDPFAAPHSDGKLAPAVESRPAPQAKHVQKPPAPLPPWRPGAAEAKIEKALASMTQLEFVDAQLEDVIDYLKETHKIEILLDKRVLEDVNVTRETPVTINVKGVCLRSALRLMLRNMQPEMTYIVRDEVLLITTPEVESEELVTRVYPVGDLVACRDEHDAIWDDYDTLIDVITGTVKPTSWEDVGAPGAIRGSTLGTAKVLTVTQTQEIHAEVAGLLAKIREIAKKDPNAMMPRRSRPTQPSGRCCRRVEPSSVGTTNGSASGGTVPSTASKPPEKPVAPPKPAEPRKPAPK
jgi:hypothetical protein